MRTSERRIALGRPVNPPVYAIEIGFRPYLVIAGFRPWVGAGFAHAEGAHHIDRHHL